MLFSATNFHSLDWADSEIVKAAPGFEPGIKVLQTSALPLGYAAIRILILAVPRSGKKTPDSMRSSEKKGARWPEGHANIKIEFKVFLLPSSLLVSIYLFRVGSSGRSTSKPNTEN